MSRWDLDQPILLLADVVALPRRQCWTTQWMVTFLYICMIATGNVIVCWGWYSYRQSVLLIVCRCVWTSSLAHSHTSQQTLWTVWKLHVCTFSPTGPAAAPQQEGGGGGAVRKSTAKLSEILEIERAVQERWQAEKTFQVDAPQPGTPAAKYVLW